MKSEEMESETLDNSQISAMKKSCSSSWPIIRGSLDDIVTCESSISAVDDSDSKLPLILRRPSPDSAPCEITVLFTQQHEIKQVYIRSTARVYEIYCATNEKSENEYLCTVRCSIAARVEEPQLETDGVGSMSTNSNKSLDEVHSRTDSGSSTDGDGWVDVKSNNSSGVDAGDSSFSKKEESCLVQVIQDRFEATAEISDGDPIMSITLRLLSIQSGDYTYIDEVYVFADPVVSAENHCSVPSLETSSGGALLSMFIPTLLQLSKSRMSKVQEDSGCAAGERSMNQDTEQHSTGSAAIGIVQTEILPSMVHNGSFVHQSNPQNRPHFTDRDNDLSCSKIEKTLDELVSRVSKIEGFCLRFEENMLRPIINMETRLERVEQQLESFIKNPQNPSPRTGCTRYSAPEFSCSESESNSIRTGGNDCPAILKSEPSKKDDFCPPELCIPSSDAYVLSSTSASKLLPGLIISAPEFSYIDEEEEINSMEAVKDSPIILKKPMSIDDALASALAGFVTSASTKSLELTDTVEEAEIVFGAERSGSTSPSALSIALAKQLECTVMGEEPENLSGIQGSPKTFLSVLVDSYEHQLSSIPIDGGNKDAMISEKDYLRVSGGEETTEAVDGNNHVVYEGSSKMTHTSSDSGSVDSIGETEFKGSFDGIGCTESDHDAYQTCVINGAPLKDVDVCTGEGIPAVFQDIMEVPSPGIVDFSVGLLDVKFSSLENSSAKSFVESLLVDTPDLGCEVACVREDAASSINEQYDLVVIEKDESRVSESVNNKLFYDDDYNYSVYMPPETELQDSSSCSNQGTSASLI